MDAFNAMGKRTIAKAKVTLVLMGYGILTVTDEALVWNKSASSFLAFGALSAMSENHLMIPIFNIARVETYTYFPGGGLVVTLNDGKEHKIAFKRKADFKVVYEYLQGRVA